MAPPPGIATAPGASAQDSKDTPARDYNERPSDSKAKAKGSSGWPHPKGAAARDCTSALALGPGTPIDSKGASAQAPKSEGRLATGWPLVRVLFVA